MALEQDQINTIDHFARLRETESAAAHHTAKAKTRILPTDAANISRLFNSIAVADMMIRGFMEKNRLDLMTDAEANQSCDIFDGRRMEATRELRDKYGIKVVGVTLK